MGGEGRWVIEMVERRRLGRRTQRLRWRAVRERARVGVILMKLGFWSLPLQLRGFGGLFIKMDGKF